MIQSPMSTVEEDETAAITLTSGHPSSPLPQESRCRTRLTRNVASGAQRLVNSTTQPVLTAPFKASGEPHQQQSSTSGVSEGSYHSARSDSESSGRRSTNTDLTDPTTADSLSRAGESADHEVTGGSAIESPDVSSLASATLPTSTSSQSSKAAMGLHRNESQSTIRRLGSNGSDASLGTASKPPTRSTSTSLPTHHELPASSDQSDDVILPVFQSVPLAKRGSQSSSRGHHRTPSRTKRRSLSSGGLSDHHPPLLGRKPVDYTSQLADLQPANFSTATEQNLLHQLSTLGMDVGQMVHSVVTDACDTSGAMWWMLLRKARDRRPEQLPASPAVADSINTTVDNTPSLAPTLQQQEPSVDRAPANAAAVLPPPVPVKDPARQHEDRPRTGDKARSSFTASRSEGSVSRTVAIVVCKRSCLTKSLTFPLRLLCPHPRRLPAACC